MFGGEGSDVAPRILGACSFNHVRVCVWCVCMRMFKDMGARITAEKRCGETNPLACGRCAKGLAVVEPGTLNKCIYGVISGSLLVQDKDGECSLPALIL